MAITITPSARFKMALTEGLINFGQLGANQGTPHSFTCILMQSGYTFDITAHGYYSDVVAQELTTMYGYNRNSKIVNPLTKSLDSQNNLIITIPPISWVASGGNIGPFSGAIIIDNTPSSNNQKVVICYLGFGGNTTIEANNSFYIYNVQLTI